MKKIGLVLIALLVYATGFAQPWLEGVEDENMTFYEIQGHFENYLKKAKRDRQLKGGGEDELPAGYNQYKRWEYFWEARLLGTNGTFPDPKEIASLSLSATSSAQSQNLGNWTPVGPFNAPNGSLTGIGRLNSVIFHPTNQNVLWAGAPAGGLWKSIDGGVNWTTNTDHLPNLGVSSLAIDPLHPDTMYMATGDRVNNGYPTNPYTYGVLKSVDGGDTWNPTGLTFSISQQTRIGSLHIINNNTQVVLAATRMGIYKSTDGGATWTNKQFGPFNIIVSSKAQPNVLYAGTSGSQGRIWRSKDSGDTWTLLTSVLPTNGVNRVELAVTDQDSNYVYAVFSESGTSSFAGLYQSTDGGDSWTLKSSSPNILGGDISGSSATGQGWYDLAITVNPTNKNQIFVGGVNIFRSNNQGANWIGVASWRGQGGTPYVHADIHFYSWQPNTNHLFVATDGGIFKTANSGTSWTPLYDGMDITQYYKVSNSETNNTLFLGGSQDNGTHRQLGASWDEVNGGDGTDNGISHSNYFIMYASSQNGRFVRSTNAGTSFSPIGSSLTPNGTGNWVTPLQIDPVNGSTAYIGYTQLWKSANNGISWAPTSSQSIAVNNINVFSIAPSNNQLIFVSIGNGLYRSGNGGVSWTQLSSPSSSQITSIAFSNVNANHVWITYSGYGSGQKVFESTNGGSSWTNISGSLPALPVNCIIYENGSLDGVYIGTDIGVYYRDATMTDWTPFFKGMPNVMVYDLEINYTEGTLIAATFGRGIWKTPRISNFLGAPVANFTANPASVCTTTDVVTLTDESEFNPNQWKWSIYPNTFAFVNGTSDSSQNAQVLFSAKGAYSVTLTATNGYGTSTKTITRVVSVGGQALPFTEDFEDASFKENWTIENPDNNKTWQSAIVGGSQPGNQAITMNFYNYSSVGQKDGLISPPLNFSGFSGINLTFDHAYRKYNTAKNDSLIVYISTDCGANWTLLQAFGENGTSNWVTGSNSTSVFVPTTSANWCGSAGVSTCKTINLNSYAGNDEVRIKFVAVNAFGNNLYLDNINISGTPSTKPTANFIGDTTGCTIGSYSFYDVSTNNPSSWSWLFPGGSPANSTQANPVVSYAVSGNYQVTLYATNVAGTDTLVQSNFISVNQAVTPSVSIASSATSICAEDVLTITPTPTNAGSNPQYVWYRNGFFEDVNTGALVLTNARNGDVFKCVMHPSDFCVTNDSVVSNTVSVAVVPLPIVSLTPFANVCSGDSPFALTGGTPVGGTYSGPGVSNGIFDPQAAGIGVHLINYDVTGSSGCMNSEAQNITVNNGPPKPTVSYTNLTLKASPISSSYTYQWLDAQQNAIPGATDTVYTPYVVGDYFVKLTFINNCVSVSNAFSVAIVGIDESSLNNGISIFPNPVVDVLTAEVVFETKTTLTVRVQDVTGKLLIEQKHILDGGAQRIPIQVRELPAGTYILEISDDKNVLQSKFVKH